MNKMKKVTLISPALNLISGIVVFVMIVTLFFSFYINFKNRKRSVLETNKVLVESIEASLINSLLVDDAVEINRLMGGVVELSKVGSNVYIIDHNDRAVYAWPNKQLEYQMVDLKKLVPISASFDHANTNDFIVSEANGYLMAQKMLKVADTPYYWRLITVYSLSSFKKEVVVRILIYVLAFLIISYIVFVLSNLLLKRKLYPLADIIEQISAISNGQYDLDEIPEPSTRNFRELIFGFNKMKQNIKEFHKNSHLIAIGRSTAMVAHDVRRPLSSMKALLGSLPHIKDDQAQIRKMVASVDKSITQTNALLNDIMEFSRDTIVLELKETDPQSVIVSAVGDAMRNYPKNLANIEYDLRHKMKIYADGTRLARVLTNIIDNALGAMRLEGGMVYGTVWIKTESVDGKMRLCIADSGPGIPEDIIDKIFEPFFTHGKKGGTGLGLAICQKIIEKHGGRIEVRNRGVIASERSERSNPPNRVNLGDCHAPSGLAMTGAEFIIEIPEGQGAAFINKSELIYNAQELDVFRQEEEVREEYGDTANKQAFMEINKERGRKSTLLLIDDEPLFRETIRSLLNGIKDVHEHVKVVEVDSAETGLKLFEACGVFIKGDSPHSEGGLSPFDYVIADIDLGRRQMNGYEFTKRIMQKYPQTYVLIHSNKRKGEMDEEIRVIASGAKQSPTINCAKGIATTAEGGLPPQDRRTGAMTSHFMGFLPKPMTSSELLQFLACKSFEERVIAPASQSSSGWSAAGAKQSPVVNCAQEIATAPSEPRNDMSKKTVLLVNDDEAFSFNMKCDLKAQGLQVLTATNVSDALQHLTTNKFDAIFSDINLEHPTINGYEFLAEVRKKDASLPFIFMSGYSKNDEWPKAQKAGATDYLQLPFEMEELISKLGV